VRRSTAVSLRGVAPRALIASAYAAIAVAMTFPTRPARLRTHLPGDTGDALLNLWTLRWAGRHLGSWSGLWDTSIFHPHDGTLAYSESMIPVAIAHRILAVIVRSDVTAFNLLYVGCAFGSLWCTFVLAKRLAHSTEGAFVAGLVYTLAAPRLSHFWHFQLGFGFLVPVVVLCTIRFFERPGRARALLLGLATATLMLATSYYGLMTAVVLLVLVPGLLVWLARDDRRAAVRSLAAAAVVAAIIVLPVAAQYSALQRDSHFRRSPGGAVAAHLGDFLLVAPGNYLLGRHGPLAARSASPVHTIENRLFPGTVAIVLGGTGAIAFVRRRRARAGHDPLGTRAIALLGAAGAVLLALSFGTRVWIGDLWIPMPYAVLRYVPVFSNIRATARFVAFPLLVLAVLTAIGVQRLVEGRPRALRIAVTLVCSAIIVAESAIPINFVEVPDRAAARVVNTELARRPRAPVVELPMNSSAAGVAWPYVEMPRQWLARIDGHPRVGGYSGYEPPGFVEVARELNTFPAATALRRLDDLGVRYVVLRLSHPGTRPDAAATVDVEGVAWYSDARARTMIAAIPPSRARRVDRYGDAWLVELAPAAG
jgi:hypothetical protein